jgi:metal-responsive CopG/Arc/MetJ family transcriptional regulator
MKKRPGPKTKASKGQRRHVQMTITIPAKLADKIASLIEAEHLTRSEIISILLKKALKEEKYDKFPNNYR